MQSGNAKEDDCIGRTGRIDRLTGKECVIWAGKECRSIPESDAWAAAAIRFRFSATEGDRAASRVPPRRCVWRIRAVRANARRSRCRWTRAAICRSVCTAIRRAAAAIAGDGAVEIAERRGEPKGSPRDLTENYLETLGAACYNIHVKQKRRVFSPCDECCNGS